LLIDSNLIICIFYTIVRYDFDKLQKIKGKEVALFREPRTTFYSMSIEILTSTILSKMSNLGKWQTFFL